VTALRRLTWPLFRPYFFYALDRIAETDRSAAPPSEAGTESTARGDAISPAGHTSYAQSGEDMILDFVLERLGVKGEEIRYVDIGAATPDWHNNTYLLYRKGGSGVLVEADPQYLERYSALRSRDEVVSAAAVPARLREKGSIEFHLGQDAGWSSVHRDHLDLAERLGKGGVRKTIVAQTRTINEILDAFAGRTLHVLSIDAEGIDAELVSEVDFSRVRPWLLVIEEAHGDGGALRALLSGCGYEPYASTYINAIYIERAALDTLKARF
jgi:FkbM family methyltransferase